MGEDNRKEVLFFYDVICPFAYMASRMVSSLSLKYPNVNFKWEPVSLGTFSSSFSLSFSTF